MITSSILQEARNLPFVGERLANKIYEIITSGHLRRLDNVDHEKEKAIEMFKGIHGVGTTTAQHFYAKVRYRQTTLSCKKTSSSPGRSQFSVQIDGDEATKRP